MRARELGCEIVINTDAHRTSDLDLMRYGVEQARRAWLQSSDVLNTLPCGELIERLRGSSSTTKRQPET
jgi:DNA polymerase (family 10)